MVDLVLHCTNNYYIEDAYFLKINYYASLPILNTANVVSI
jgi:hypothetical protein